MFMFLTLNPVIRGWANYHRHVVSKDIFSSVDARDLSDHQEISLPDTFVQAPVTAPEKLAVLEASGKTPARVRLLKR